MKKMAVVLLFLICCSLPAIGLAGGCPEGKYYDTQSKKCITPGDDPTGKTERNFRRQLIEENPELCVDGWCCPDERIYGECIKQRDKVKCLKKKGCFVQGE